ncbi:MAG: AAA family ATPase [Candidatus Riflebacteria bacterium]|nr:AAA family ATPase [Candidatus Riflebacteria bacterium]
MTLQTQNIDQINEARARIVDYYTRLNDFFLKRSDLLKLMLVAVAAQEPMLFIGRPGTAKSMLVSIFCQGLGMKSEDYFEYMLTKFSEPSEIMGPVDIQELKSGRYLRKVDGHLPTAKIAFLDEIFKANSAILNMLLTVINERKYYQEGKAIPVPLVCMFAASNEIPDFGEFDALKDRFIIKAETLSVRDSCFHELIRMGVSFESRIYNREKPWKSDCTLDDFILIHDYVVSTVLPNAIERDDKHLLGDERITTAFKALISVLADELKVEITDRKLIKLYKVILTQAFIFNGGNVTRDDLKILCYCGNNFSDVRKIKDYIEERLANLD